MYLHLKKTSFYYKLIISILAILSFSNIKSTKAFVPYIYEPNLNALNNTAISIGQTAVQILQLNQPEEAIRLSELAISIQPKDYRLWAILGESQKQSGLLKEADISLSKAISINSNKASLWFAHGTLAIQRKKPNQAIFLLKKGLKLEPKNPIAYFQIGNAEFMQVKLKKALKSYEKALSMKSDFWESLNNKGLILFEMGKEKEAIKAWQKVIIISRNSEPLLALAAALYKNSTTQEAAIKLAKESLDKNPNYVSATHQKEQLWGNRLISATKELLAEPKLSREVERALANSDSESIIPQ